MAFLAERSKDFGADFQKTEGGIMAKQPQNTEIDKLKILMLDGRLLLVNIHT